jgi:hypothetical protein
VEQPPGTVSRILWHFTGGPRWNKVKNRQEGRPKPASEAYEALLSILTSKELRLGQYREVVKVLVPKLRRYNAKKHQTEEIPNTIVELRSSPVCCLADIPVAHLSYQAKRYGRLAIGFHRDAAVRHGFNPVFYTLQDTKVLRSVYQGFAQLRQINARSLREAEWNIDSQVEDLTCKHGHPVDTDSGLYDAREQLRDIGDAVSEVQTSLTEFLAFVKTFNQREFSTIYCEREWRSTKPFPFTTNDVAMIVLPKIGSETSYFNLFVGEEPVRLNFPRSIPVVPWEDLVEH